MSGRCAGWSIYTRFGAVTGEGLVERGGGWCAESRMWPWVDHGLGKWKGRGSLQMTRYGFRRDGSCELLADRKLGLSLGTRGDLPSRQMLSFCWFCAKLAQPLPTRQMLGKF